MSEGKFTCMMFTIVQTLCDSIKNYFNFCIEIFKEENKLTGKEVYELFEKYGVLKYLYDGYDMLHTQGDKWLMNDINEFLKIRGYNVKNGGNK